ncbi:ribose-phosphate diphosphokinase (plasmid) [Haloferacaceae archaeon DSL9]
MQIITTPSAEHLDLDAIRLEPHPRNDSRLFPDDEVFVRVESIEAVERAFVVHSGQPHPNRGLAFLYGVLDLCAEHGIPVTLCLTYAPYGMQDKPFYPGTVTYARTFLKAVTECYDVQRVYAVDPHFSHRDWVDAYPLRSLHAFPLIQERVDADLNEYVVVGPDLGAVDRFGIPGFEKTRTGASDVELRGELDVDRKNVLVFDDLIETGGTMVAAYDRLKEQGAETVTAASVHAVLDEGVRRVKATYDGFYATNTIATEVSNVSIEPLVRDVVRG